MREMSIAMEIVDLAVHEAKKANAGKIISVDLEIGEMAGVLVDSLLFCFKAAARNTMAEHARIHIEDVTAEWKCIDCGNVFHDASYRHSCPACSSSRATLIHGNELRVKSIIVDQ